MALHASWLVGEDARRADGTRQMSQGRWEMQGSGESIYGQRGGWHGHCGLTKARQRGICTCMHRSGASARACIAAGHLHVHASQRGICTCMHSSGASARACIAAGHLHVHASQRGICTCMHRSGASARACIALIQRVREGARWRVHEGSME
ncbi:unnamed protein product [Closterium sp. NIES-53]